MNNILIIGATSAIAEACARVWAGEGSTLFLVARDQERLLAMSSDLLLRGASQVYTTLMDCNDFSAHLLVLNEAFDQLGKIDCVLIAHGTLADQAACEADFEQTLRELNTNGLSVVSLLTHLANLFAVQGRGTIAVLCSVAGDRGRQSNYVYGSAKALVITFLQGLRQRLAKSGVRVVTIKPGFVDSPMTGRFTKGLLWAKPEVVARRIVARIKANDEVLYTPWFWWGIMLVIRLIPERLFKRLSL